MPEVVREGSLRKSILFCFLAERTVWIMIRRSYHGNAMVVRNEYSKLLFLHSCVVYGDIHLAGCPIMHDRHIQASCASRGEGIYEGIDWLPSSICKGLPGKVGKALPPPNEDVLITYLSLLHYGL